MIPPSPQLLQLLIHQNEEALRGLRRMPPGDPDSASGRQQLMAGDQLFAQTEALRMRLKELIENPPPRPKRRTWRDIPPAGTWK